MMVTLYTQADFIEGVILFTEGYHVFQDVTTRVKFALSTVMRIIIGTAGMFATFLLVMFSTEVVEMLLNFTGPYSLPS